MRESPLTQNPRVILVAPNVSEQMGGEAIKALQIYQELERAGFEVHQITHERAKRELDAKHPHMHVTYVRDSLLQRFFWKSVVLRPLLRLHFQWYAARLARAIASGEDGRTVVHYTGPSSPVRPIFRMRDVPVILGPVNGNVAHPPAFRAREDLTESLRRLGHSIAQRLQRAFFNGKQQVEVILVAGGERTYRSLLKAGCREDQFVDSLDSGVLNRLLDAPRITHEARNLRFVHNGRLVAHKGADLAIRALARTKHPVELEIIGRGPERLRLERLAKKLFVSERVKFTPWIEDHSKLPEYMRQFRGMVFPSLAEANGIVVQEAMVLGLPVICLDWGGPALLVDPRCAYVIKPVSEEFVINEIAWAMDDLAENFEKAEAMSKAGRELAVAKGFMWADIITRWVEIYRKVTGAHAGRAIVARPRDAVTIEIDRIGDRVPTTGLLDDEFAALEARGIHIEH